MRSREAILAVFALVLGNCAAPAQDPHGWAVNGVLDRDELWRGHDGPFLASLFLTDNAEAVYERWRTQPGNFQPGNVHDASPGAHVEAVVVFARCQPDSDGNCHVWGTATIEADGGRLLARQVEIPLWVGHPPPPDPALGIAEHGIALVVEESASSYSFSMVVSDRVARREVKLLHYLTVRHTQ